MSDAALAPRDLSGFVRDDADGVHGLDLLVKGARCAACIGKIERAVSALPGVAGARLNLTTGRLSVRWKGPADPVAVVEAVEGLGYGATPFDPIQFKAEEDREGRRLLLALGVAAFGAGNVMMFSVPVWAGLFGQELGPAARTLMYWLSALIAAPCAVYAGMPFFRSAWASLRKGRANMDVPISVGVILTLVISFSETMLGGAHAYFDAAVSLLFLLLIGRYLDHRLRASARSAARDLLALQAPVARLVDVAGVERGVPVGKVTPGDVVAVAAGERVPVDGVVESGAAGIDTSLITGESAPARVTVGETVHAGALSLDGRILVRATQPADRSAVAEIARMMEAGAQARSRYVRLADKAAALYVPVVHLAALATLLGWWAAGLGFREALVRAVAVLIITCPCALGLAVPAVQITASGRLFRKGVLVKSGAALERLAEVDHVIFDKTGVLTTGEPALVEAPAGALQRAAGLARASRHPLARGLAAAAGVGPVAGEAVELPGLGVEGLVDGRKARLGSAAFLQLDAEPGGGPELWFAIGGEAPVRFRFEESLRTDAAEVIADIVSRGLSVELLSGDRPAAVRAAAAAAGIAAFAAEMTPAQKADRVARLQAEGRRVLMVGDGLNDAAALAGAHASMAPGSALDASQNAADLVFGGDGLSPVVLALDVARAARTRALENFAFAALYNAVAAPAAMAGLVNPLVAAVAMAGSSLVVTLNALRMNWSGR